MNYLSIIAISTREEREVIKEHTAETGDGPGKILLRKSPDKCNEYLACEQEYQN